MRLNYEKIFKVFLLLFTCSLFIPFDTFASTMYWQPYDIVIQQPGDNNVIISANKYTLNNLDYWSFPPNQSSDFSTPASIYFRYNNGNSDYCIYQANNGSVSGQFYAANAFNANHSVKVQDRSITSRPYFNCSSTLNSNTHYLEFTCNNLNLSHNYNFIITNANAQRYGIRANVEVDCQQTIEGATNSIIDNNNSNTNRIIENNNSNTNRIVEQQEETNDLLKSEEAPNSSGFFNDVSALLDESPITNLVTIPLTLINAYISGFSSTCSAVSLGSLYGHNLTLPCIDIPQYIGSTLWATIDGITCIIIIYNIILMCIGIFESITSLDDTMQYLYTPRHGDLSREGRGHSRGDY